MGDGVFVGDAFRLAHPAQGMPCLLVCTAVRGFAPEGIP